MRTNDGTLDPTLDHDHARDDTVDEGQARDSRPARIPSNYELGEPLGRGGMGEVILAKDRKLGRSVAIKRMRAAQPSADQVARFLREARIQALLDHPAIVPVHELGEDPDGRPYFTMKRLSGKTLSELLAEHDTRQKRMLRAFVDVCLAIEFAHQRGIIHRDLKPANVMLGNYGEVWVLDWGVARVLGDVDTAGIPIESVDGETQQGAVLGTPGYMSPEQMRGDEITAATDVYALGAILFEILTGNVLHPRGAAAISTMAKDFIVSPRQRHPSHNIAPELDAACVAALVHDPAARPSARDLADAVQRYLDGDRDLERRTQLAGEHLAVAMQALPTDRAAAMRYAGRALALDPESRSAASLVSHMMLEPQDPPPPALAKRLADIDLDDMARQGRYAAAALSGYLVFVPIVAAIGINDWRLVGAASLIVIVMILGALYIAKHRIPRITWAVIAQAALMVLLSRLFNPLVLVPALAVATVAALASFQTLRIAYPIVGMALGLAIPIALDVSGLVPQLVTYSSSSIMIAPGALELGPTATPILLAAMHITVVVIVGLVVRSLAVARRDAQRKLEGQTWMLEQLLPGRAM